jgi:hypothetical protein
MPDSPKKDVLEFPLEQVSIPQAVALMMQAATQCVKVEENGRHDTDMDRLQLLCEKLEARFQDDLDAANAVRDVPTEEDAPNEAPYTDIDGHEVTLVHEFIQLAGEDMITKVVVDNTVFALLCNERVGTFTQRGTDFTKVTTCIKQFGHDVEHVDMDGNYR